MTVSSSATSRFPVDLQPGKPPTLRAEATPGDAAAWAATHRDDLRALVVEHGALLVRGLGLRDLAETEATFRQLGSLTTETEAFAPRRCFAPGVYSSSKWPPNQSMCMHHELSYAFEPPSLLLFACLSAPDRGGATPVADSRVLLRTLPDGLVERLARTGWILERTYNGDIGASLAESFGTDDRRAIEGYCRAHAIGCEWRSDGSLHTWQRRRAVVSHPVTGGLCWFNQVAFLNEWAMAPELREYLMEEYGADGLPFNTRFGNGDPIGPEVVEAINQVYEANTLREPWQAGDLLLVDNVSTAHGREAFEGPREIVVGMADAIGVADHALPT